MTADAHPSRPGSLPPPSHLIVLCLLPLLAWLPPETRGESMAGCAVLLALLALSNWRSSATRIGTHALLVTAVAGAAMLAWWAYVPAATVEPLAIGLLAVGAGLAAAPVGDGGKRPASDLGSWSPLLQRNPRDPTTAL